MTYPSRTTSRLLAVGIAMVIMSFLPTAVYGQCEDRDYWTWCVDCRPQGQITNVSLSSLGFQGSLEFHATGIAFDIEAENMLAFGRGLRNPTNVMSSFLEEHDHGLSWDWPPHSYSLDSIITSMGTNPSASRIALGDKEGNLILFDNPPPEEAASYQITLEPIADILISATETSVIFVAGSDQIGVFDVESETTNTLSMPHEVTHVSNIELTSDGEFLIAGLDGDIAVWNAADYGFVGVFPTVMDHIDAIVTHPSNPELIYTIIGTQVTGWVWDGEAMSEVISFQTPESPEAAPEFVDSTISPDGSLLMGVYNERDFAAWETLNGNIVEIPAFDSFFCDPSYPAGVFSIAISPDGLWLVLGTSNGMFFFVIP
jgi:WD40 repeat protein